MRGTRLFTPEEVLGWRERARKGPYRIEGDAGPNSPGDWTRITANADAFVDDPPAAIWQGPSGPGCVGDDAEQPPDEGPSRLRDAAFVALVTGSTTHGDAARAVLLEQARRPGVDFTDDQRWCPGRLADRSPAFQIANWLTKLLLAYDFEEERFTARERVELDAWFAGAAGLFADEIARDLDPNFVDRDARDLRISEERYTNPGCAERRLHHDGPASCALSRYYNNRRAAMARFVGLVGVHQGDERLRGAAARFVDEFLAYSVYPDGSLGEFERWREDLPDLGWAYAANTAGAVITIADAFARTGDPSLYRLGVSAGAFGSEPGPEDDPKSIPFAIDALYAHIDGRVERYALDDEQGRIDGRHDSWQSVHDMALVPANRFFCDAGAHGVYTRTDRDLDGYPASPAPNGPHEPWTGEGGIYPGVLFMFGNLEASPPPYPEHDCRHPPAAMDQREP